MQVTNLFPLRAAAALNNHRRDSMMDVSRFGGKTLSYNMLSKKHP
jgi:hypothetical protein